MRISPPIAVARPLSPEPQVVAFRDSDFATMPKPAFEIIRIDTTEQIEALLSQLIETNNLLDCLKEAAMGLNDIICGLRACYGLPNSAIDRWNALHVRLSAINDSRPGLYDWASKTKRKEKGNE